MGRTVSVIGVPMDLGADRRGVDMGPSAIRYGGLDQTLAALGHTVVDEGDLAVPRPEAVGAPAEPTGDESAKYLSKVKTVCERLADRVATVREDGVALVLGGDHSIAIGTAAGIADEQSTGVLWFDAHGDFNTPATTPSGNIHGMSLAAMLGMGRFAGLEWAQTPTIEAKNVALVGLRDVDEQEKQSINESAVTAYTMTDIDERGITSVVREAIQVATAGTDQLYLSFDMDFLDPTEAPGVGTPVRGGASYREAHSAMEVVHNEAPPLAALELVEVNPILDQHNRTAELACELAASALGDRIL